MAILSFQIIESPGLVGLYPRRGKILSTNTYAEVTAAGYLNGVNTQGETVKPNDIFDVVYNYISANSPGTYVQLIASVAAGVITLNATAGDVILPVVSGDFAVFSGTSGAIADSGLLPSATGQVYVATTPGSLTTGQLAEFKDTHGTLENSGLLASNAMSVAAVNTMAAGSNIILDKALGTIVSNAVTLNKQSGSLTTPSLSTASGSSYTVTLTNSLITANSLVFCQVEGGLNTTAGITFIVASNSGFATILLENSGVAAAALNGTVIFSFVVF